MSASAPRTFARSRDEWDRAARSPGRLVAKVLGVSLAAAADSCKGAAAGVDAPAVEYSVRIECRRGDKLMGGVTSKRGVNKDGKTVDVKQKMRFNLPAAKDEGEITLRLCDAKGKTVARSGLTLVDVLRVSPITKDTALWKGQGPCQLSSRSRGNPARERNLTYTPRDECH